MRPVHERQCEKCGKTFWTRLADRMRCSSACRAIDRKCKGCGDTFFCAPSARQVYCSQNCSLKNLGERLRTRPYVECVTCKQTFYQWRDGQRFCSEPCRYAGRRSPKRRKTCERCGVQLRPGMHAKARFCSRACSKIGQVREPYKHAKLGETRPGPKGYVLIKVSKDHPEAYAHGWLMHHRFMVEQHLGRYLEKHERVHHRNGKRDENTVGPCVTKSGCDCGVEPKHNLELWRVEVTKDPSGVRAADYHCPGCRCFEHAPAAQPVE